MEEGRGLSVGVITLEQRLLWAFAHWHCFALQMTEWICIFVLGFLCSHCIIVQRVKVFIVLDRLLGHFGAAS